MQPNYKDDMSKDLKLNYSGSKLTKTEETIKKYRHVGNLIWERACIKFSTPNHNLSPTQLYAYLNEIFSSLRPRTIRAYLASSREFLRYRVARNLIPVEYHEDAKKTLELLESVSASHFKCENNKDKNLPFRTSRKKSKRLPSKSLKTLISEFKNDKKPPKWSRETLVMLIAGLITGLRPIEWRTAKIEGVNLVVQNAKNTNGRANGDFRHINISDLLPSELKFLMEHIKACKLYSKNIDAWQLQMGYLRSCLRILNKKYLPKSKLNISMYSARHQFAANAKSAGLNFEEVAALMGHVSNATAFRSYGKRRFGKGSLNVSPKASEVATVRKAYVPRTYINNLKNKPKPSSP